MEVEKEDFRDSPMIFACLIQTWSTDPYWAVECVEIPVNILMLVQKIQWFCDVPGQTLWILRASVQSGISASPVFPKFQPAQGYVPVIPSTTPARVSEPGLDCFHHQNNYFLKKCLVLLGNS